MRLHAYFASFVFLWIAVLSGCSKSPLAENGGAGGIGIGGSGGSGYGGTSGGTGTGTSGGTGTGTSGGTGTGTSGGTGTGTSGGMGGSGGRVVLEVAVDLVAQAEV